MKALDFQWDFCVLLYFGQLKISFVSLLKVLDIAVNFSGT